MNKKYSSIIVIIGFLLIGLSFYFVNKLDQKVMQESFVGVVNISSSKGEISDKLKLKYLDGKDFVFDNFKGKFSLVYLGEFCSEDCNNILQKIDNLFSYLPVKEKDNMQFIFVSSKQISNSEMDKLNRYGFSQVIIAKAEEFSSFKENLIESAGDDSGGAIYLLNPKVKLVTIFTDSAAIQDMVYNIRMQFTEYAQSSYGGFLTSKEFLIYIFIFCFGLIGISTYALNKLRR